MVKRCDGNCFSCTLSDCVNDELSPSDYIEAEDRDKQIAKYNGEKRIWHKDHKLEYARYKVRVEEDRSRQIGYTTSVYDNGNEKLLKWFEKM